MIQCSGIGHGVGTCTRAAFRGRPLTRRSHRLPGALSDETNFQMKTSPWAIRVDLDWHSSGRHRGKLRRPVRVGASRSGRGAISPSRETAALGPRRLRNATDRATSGRTGSWEPGWASGTGERRTSPPSGGGTSSPRASNGVILTFHTISGSRRWSYYSVNIHILSHVLLLVGHRSSIPHPPFSAGEKSKVRFVLRQPLSGNPTYRTVSRRDRENPRKFTLNPGGGPSFPPPPRENIKFHPWTYSV